MSTYERGPFLVSSWGSSWQYKRFVSCLGCSSWPSTKQFFFTVFEFNCVHVVLGLLSLNMCLWPYAYRRRYSIIISQLNVCDFNVMEIFLLEPKRQDKVGGEVALASFTVYPLHSQLYKKSVHSFYMRPLKSACHVSLLLDLCLKDRLLFQQTFRFEQGQQQLSQ